MFVVTLFSVCVPACWTIRDKLGPYETRAECESRIELVLTAVDLQYGENYSYRAGCSILLEDGTFDEYVDYMGEGDMLIEEMMKPGKRA